MKDYKKILEGVVNIINTTKKSDIGFANICTYIGENCPELKESEDERIRQRIIPALHGDVLEMSEIKEAIAWLEKQGEHANFRNKIQIGDKVTRNEGGVLVNISQLNRVAKERKKQGGEQILANSAKTCKDEQKPVPKFEVGDVMRTLQEAVDNITSGLPVVVSIDNEFYHCNNELIAIKDQNGYEYPPMNRIQKQEWSEEDKRKIDRIYSILGQAADTHAFSTTCRLIGDKECIELQDFLKALIPQSTWKPSDEQLDALHDAAVYIDKSMFPYPKGILMKLYEQLKKIREE